MPPAVAVLNAQPPPQSPGNAAPPGQGVGKTASPSRLANASTGALTHPPQSPGSAARKDTRSADLENRAPRLGSGGQSEPPRSVSRVTSEHGAGGSHATRRLVGIGSEGRGGPRGSTSYSSGRGSRSFAGPARIGCDGEGRA